MSEPTSILVEPRAIGKALTFSDPSQIEQKTREAVEAVEEYFRSHPMARSAEDLDITFQVRVNAVGYPAPDLTEYGIDEDEAQEFRDEFVSTVIDNNNYPVRVAIPGAHTARALDG